MNFQFQTFKEYNGFAGPIDTYSFFNENGCFTIHCIVQKNEWTWYKSKKFSYNQYELLESKININLFVGGRYWFYSSVLKKMSTQIKNQALNTSTVFGISIRNTGDDSMRKGKTRDG